MGKFRLLLQALLLFALSAGLAGALRTATAQTDAALPAAFTFVAENTTFQLYADYASLGFGVVDKRSGYVWYATLPERKDDDRLNRTWTAFATSGISIDFLDAKAIAKRASVTNADHTLDIAPLPDGFEALLTFSEPSITLKVIVRLEEAGVRVEVPFGSVVEADPQFKLGVLYVYPFFAATRTDQTPGYMFIPDGAGSLVRFQSQTKATNMFYGRYYGADLGMIARLPLDLSIRRPFNIAIPVLGMVHGEGAHAYIAVVEKGAAYGEIHAHPAGVITNFNFLYNAFTYNRSYFQATNRSGAGVTTLQPRTNAFDVAIHYRFLDGAESDYVGMARSYQRYLVERGVLKPSAERGQDIGIRLEFLGSEKEKVLFWQRPIPMTTLAQMDDILTDLDVRHPQVVYYGWQPLGASSMPPTSFKLERALGSRGQLREIADGVTAEGGAFYLYLDPQAAFVSERGYSPRYDLAMSITNFNLIGNNRNQENYYFNYNALRARYAELSRDVFDEPNVGLAIDGLGATLYSDYKTGNVVNREEAIGAVQQILSAQAGQTAFYTPNDYVWGFTRAYFDIPLANSNYLYTTDIVPFVQIVLSGHIPYYGTALNFSSNLQDDLLRHADFGAYPSFFLTQEITAKILNTHSSWIYTSSYAQWGEEIARAYAWLNGLLAPVQGEPIVARETPSAGVAAVTYANGVQIVVNYTDRPYLYQGVLIPAKDAVSREVTP